MVNKIACHLVRATLLAAVVAGCTFPPVQITSTGTSVSATGTSVGALEPVYNPPPGTPFRCIGTGDVVTPDRVPGDIDTPLPQTNSPVATMGNRRGDWLLIVTRTGEIGWIDDPHEMSLSQEYPGAWCQVHQDAQGAPITKIMLDVGFQTKSNFNREFLRTTGQTPSGFRQSKQSNLAANMCIATGVPLPSRAR
jgi:AraC-like DNA-binding protein